MGASRIEAPDVVKVILVDDEVMQSEMVKFNLRRLDPCLSIDSVCNPEQALEILRTQPYECVVSDYQMPGMNGIEFCGELRRFSGVPFIIYTGRGSEEVASQAFAAGADDYVRKEKEVSHFSVLARRIRHAVERKRYEDLYRVSIEDNRDGFALIQGINFVYANQAMANMLGLGSPSELVGSSILRWVVEMERDMVGGRALNRQRGHQEPRIYEYRVRRADGEIRTLEASVSLISYLGEPASLVFNKDVTERKKDELRLKMLNEKLESTNSQLESSNTGLSAAVEELHVSKEELNAVNEELKTSNEQLRQSREELREYSDTLEVKVSERTAEILSNEEMLRESALYTRSLIEASLDPFVTIDNDGKITDVNEATVRMTGVPRDRLIGSDFSGYFTEPERAREGYNRVFAEGQIRDYPLVMRHTSGRVTYVLYHATLYRDSKGVVQGVFAAARDITNRRRNEERLREAERNAAMGRLTTMIAHDLKNPLNFISQATEIAKTEPRKTDRMLQLIKESAGRSLSIVENLRQITGEITLNRVDADITQLMKGVAEQTRVSDNVRVAMDAHEALEVPIDTSLMRRALENLVGNAVDAMPDGGTLTMRTRREGDMAHIEVEDTGTGIPDEVVRHLFDPFYTTKPRGRGLGLMLVKRIVEAHGGSLTFTTKVDAGTKFIIEIPTNQAG